MYKLTCICRWALPFSGQSSLVLAAVCVFITCEKCFMPWKHKMPYYRHKGTVVTRVFGYITPLYQLQFGHFLLNLSTELYLWFVYSVYPIRMRWAGHVARMSEERGVYRVLVGKPERRRPMGRARRRWVDNIRTDLQELGCGYMDWIGLAQDRDGWRTLLSAVMNLRVPWNAGNFLTDCKPVSCSRRTLHHGISK